MTVSSRSGHRSRVADPEFTTATQQRPQHIYESPGQSWKGLGSCLPFTGFFGLRTAATAPSPAQARQGGHGEGAPHPPVVSLGDSAGLRNPTGIARDRGHVGMRRQTSGVGEVGQVTAGPAASNTVISH